MSVSSDDCQRVLNDEATSDNAYSDAEDDTSDIESEDDNTYSDSEGDTSDIESESEGETRQQDTISKIESLVLVVLSQLVLTDSTRRTKNTGRRKIQDESILDDSDDQAEETKPTRSVVQIELANRRKNGVDGGIGTKYVRYPKNGKNAGAKQLAQLYRLLEIMHEALITGIPATKRDIYYRDTMLFRTQATVDALKQLVDDIAATFEIERSDLNVRATLKGLVSGSGLVIHLRDCEEIRGNDSEGALIPVGEDIASFELDAAVAWVLIVEKAAVFQTLCRMRLTCHPSLPGKGIMITGKGYPDLATRQLVKTFSDNLPSHVPIIALVDSDAYGIDILSVYKYGSMSLRHEREKLAAERIEWMGVWSSELSELNIDKSQLIPMTSADEKKAFAMLRKPGLPNQWRKELSHMIFTRRKAEIEILSGSDNVQVHPLLYYVARKIHAFVE